MNPLRSFLRLAAIAAFSATFAACGGGQSALNATPAVLTGTPSPSSSQAPASVNPLIVISTGANNAITLTATVYGVYNGWFEVQGGTGVGYLHIYTTSSTAYTGAKPFKGEAVEITGTGSVSTSVTASSVVHLLSASGPIDTLGSNGSFHIHGPTGVGYLWVHATSSTKYAGTKPYVGETVAVFGTGSFATSLTAISVAQVTTTSTATPAPTASPAASVAPSATPAPTATPFTPATPSSGTAYLAPPTTAFMPSSWGKISAFQVFDDTSNGYISQAAASADGWRYSAVWGSRNNIGTAWLDSNPQLQNSYYGALETDESSTIWGAIGHDITWWKAYHPSWVLYACTSSGSATTTPAYILNLPHNVPLDIHNPAVVDYQVRLMATYAHKMGYRALAIDEATFWQADQGFSGGYGCGIYQNGSWVQRYAGVNDPNWATDVVAWVKQAHAILTTDPVISTYHLKLITNHPAGKLTQNEMEFLANVDATLDETGYSDYGNSIRGSANEFLMRTNWAVYAQQHGTAILMNDRWGTTAVTTPQLDYSVATYLMGNLQAESIFVPPVNGNGMEWWHSQYQAAIGAPCGGYYGGAALDSSNPSIYYRRFANAVVVVNGGSGSYTQTARNLPAGHTYTDLFGRRVPSPLVINSNDGYVLLTSNGCN